MEHQKSLEHNLMWNRQRAETVEISIPPYPHRCSLRRDLSNDEVFQYQGRNRLTSSAFSPTFLGEKKHTYNKLLVHILSYLH